MRIIKLSAIFCLSVFLGCSYLAPQVGSLVPPYESGAAYNQIKLKESTSADVLTVIYRPESEMLSQSKSVIASQGEKKKGSKVWLNIVAFDENALTAKRKCIFVADEKAESVLFWYKRKLGFDIETVLDAEVLNEPYANENARRIAILRHVLDGIVGDVKEVTLDNKMIGVCGGLINQTLRTVLQRLDESPVLASKLSEGNGFKFDHITFGEGTIKMDIVDDMASIEVRSGSFAWSSEDPFALEQ